MLLVEVRRDRVEALKRISDFVIVSEIGRDEPRQGKLLLATAIVAGAVATATLGLLPIVGSAILGSVLLVLTRCLTLDEAYQAIERRVVFLLGGILPLGHRPGDERSGQPPVGRCSSRPSASGDRWRWSRPSTC